MKKLLLTIVSCSLLASCATPELDDQYGYINQDYNKDALINSKFQGSVQAMDTSPYTWQGEEYEETGIEDTSPFMNSGVNSQYFEDRLY